MLCLLLAVRCCGNLWRCAVVEVVPPGRRNRRAPHATTAAHRHQSTISQRPGRTARGNTVRAAQVVPSAHSLQHGLLLRIEPASPAHTPPTTANKPTSSSDTDPGKARPMPTPQHDASDPADGEHDAPTLRGRTEQDEAQTSRGPACEPRPVTVHFPNELPEITPPVARALLAILLELTEDSRKARGED